MIKLTLQEANPELVKEWHPIKNGSLTPNDVTAHSGKKVWWLCTKNHEWQAVVNHRSEGHGCPYCSGRNAYNGNCLASLKPVLAKEWHPTLNGSLTPYMVTVNSGQKVWWLCSRNKYHEWQAIIANRSKGNGCPFCAGKAACKDNCLTTLDSTLAKEWHQTKNGNLMPDKVRPGSHKKVWWICDEGHEWQSTVADRSAGNGCPFCAGKAACKDNCLATLKPALAKEWHPTLNGSLTPDMVTLGMTIKVWWLCSHGHEWQASIGNRSKSRGCPFCAGRSVCKDNCLAALNPALAKEWHPTLNGSLTPYMVTVSSSQKVWWLCSKNKDHKWQTSINNRSKNQGCPLCHPQISQLELRVYCELKYLFPSTASKKKISGKECDVYIPEIKAGVEVDGVYWHRNKYLKDKEKSDAMRSEGITLIRVREAGLKKISDTDILCTPKDGDLNVTKKIVRMLNEQCSLNQGKRKALDEYLQRQTFVNDSEYKKLWNTLPSPLPGLSLLEQKPALAKEWHPTLNGDLTPSDVSPHNHQKVWWLCSKNKDHKWQAVIFNRSRGIGCPFCAGKAACKDNCLATLNPALAKEWHPTLNGGLTPDMVTTHSGKKVWWLCSHGHHWQATVANRSNGKGCPRCRGLKKTKSN